MTLPIWLDYAVDGLLALLLIGGIIACFGVIKRLETMREGQSEMRGLIEQLNKAVLDAQRNIAEMKFMAGDMAQNLGNETKKAKALQDELQLIVEAGNNLADKIERGLTGTNHNTGAHMAQAHMPTGREASYGGAGSTRPESAGQSTNQEAIKQAQKQQALLAALKQAR